jgi:hypothetical protein
MKPEHIASLQIPQAMHLNITIVMISCETKLLHCILEVLLTS